MKKFISIEIWFPVLLSSLFVMVFFWQTFLRGLVPVPLDALVGLYHPYRDFYQKEYPRGIPFKNFLITDPVRQQIPWRKVVVDEITSGILPWWNPFSFSGVKLAANIQSGAYYPFNIIFFFLPFDIGWTVLIILQPFLAVLFMFLFLRKKGLSKIASSVGSMCFGYSGFSIAWLTWGTIGHVVLWVPLILLTLENIVRENFPFRTRAYYLYSFLLILFLFFQISGGHMQIALYCIFFEAAYAVYTLRALHSPRSDFYRRLSGIIIIALVFSALSAFLWFPLLQEMLSSVRSLEGAYFNTEGWFIPYQHLLQFVIPDFFGNPSTMNYFGAWNYGEFIGYIGIFPLVFAVVSVLGGKKTWFWWLFLIISLIFVTPNVIGKLPYLLRVPLFLALQPTRLLVLIDISLSVLVSYGVDVLLSLRTRKSILYGSIVPALIACIVIGTFLIRFTTRDQVLNENLSIALRNSVVPSFFAAVSFMSILLWGLLKEKRYRFRMTFAVLIVLITAVDLFRFGWKFTPFTNKEYFFPRTKLISFLENQPKPFRVAVLDDRIFPPNVLSYYGIESVDGYDPIYEKRYSRFLHALDSGDTEVPLSFERIVTVRNISSPLFRLLNVRYYITFEKLSDPKFREVFTEGETRVYEDLAFVPRAYFAASLRSVSTERRILQLMVENQEGGQYALIPGGTNMDKTSHVSDTSGSTVQFLTYSGYSMKVKTEAKEDGFLVFSQKFDPSLRVTLDGKRIQPLQVNYLFTGVRVPKGEHEISLTYSPL